MKRIIFIIYLFLFLYQIAYSQKNYSDYSDKKQNILLDDFNDNKNSWSLFDNSGELIKIENGVFYCQSKSSADKAVYIPVSFDEKKDWEIELKIKFLRGEDNNSNGLVFGADENVSKSILFAFTGNGNYGIYNFTTSSWIIGWTKSEIVNNTDYNLLTIRKIGSTYYFFLNKTFISTTSYIFYGKKIGIRCNKNSTINADYLRVSYIDSKSSAIVESPQKEIKNTENENKTTVVDFINPLDGQPYKTVKIGYKIWMAENLNDVTNSGSWCFDDDKDNCNKYGRLYDFETARKACPKGWHLPYESDWNTLTEILGGKKEAGGKLKETGNAHWKSPNKGADNSSGFNALPGGVRNLAKLFQHIGSIGRWWTSESSDALSSWTRELNFDSSKITREEYAKGSGFSVRCVKD